jgi:hypothetical protein
MPRLAVQERRSIVIREYTDIGDLLVAFKVSLLASCLRSWLVYCLQTGAPVIANATASLNVEQLKF